MATLTIKVPGYESGYYEGNTTISFDLTKDNVKDLEAALKAYREESRLPETMEEVRMKLFDSAAENPKEGLWFFAGYDVKPCGICDIEFRKQDANFFPARWQAEKLHALACMMQVWIALHGGDFSWFNAVNQYNGVNYYIEIHPNDGIQIAELRMGFQHNPFPFRTRELAEHARRILTDATISLAFSTK